MWDAPGKTPKRTTAADHGGIDHGMDIGDVTATDLDSHSMWNNVLDPYSLGHRVGHPLQNPDTVDTGGPRGRSTTVRTSWASPPWSTRATQCGAMC